MKAPTNFGQVVNRKQLGSILGVSATVIDNYIQNGCPYVQHGDRGREWKFDTAEVFRWLKEQEALGRGSDQPTSSTPVEDAKLRKAEADAELREFELARTRGETILIEDVQPVLLEELAAVRSRLMSIPGRLAQKVAAISDPEAVESAIRKEISEALRELTSDQA